MVATLTVSDLIDTARRVGVELQPVSAGGNLYVWHTPDPESAIVYIGKSASDRRLADEQSWRDGPDPRDNIRSGIVSLLRTNQAEKQAFHYDPDTFEGSAWRAIQTRDDWQGQALDRLHEALPEGQTLASNTVEHFLVRIAVRYGVPIGNSQFASQWETPIGAVPDTLAVLAVGDAMSQHV